VVILDRFYDSTTAYQGYGRESVPLDQIHEMNTIASHDHAPDLTIYLKLSLEEAKKRVTGDKDRIEQAGEDFFEKVIAGFDHLASQEDRFFTVDATQPENQVHDQIWQIVRKHFPQR
jgi:dTMP kinase